MSFVPGQVVTLLTPYFDRRGRHVDSRGRVATRGILMDPAPISATTYTTTTWVNSLGDFTFDVSTLVWTVRVWDIDAAAFVVDTYPEPYLSAYLSGGTASVTHYDETDTDVAAIAAAVRITG